MLYNDFLNAVIDDGIAEIEVEYLRPDQRTKRDGSIAGFNACRGKTEEQIVAEHKKAEKGVDIGREIPDAHDEYWYRRCYVLQIEWVLNVLSAYRVIQLEPPVGEVTWRGFKKARMILGIQEAA